MSEDEARAFTWELSCRCRDIRAEVRDQRNLNFAGLYTDGPPSQRELDYWSWCQLIEVRDQQPWIALGYSNLASYLVGEHWFNQTTAGRLVKALAQGDYVRVRWPLLYVDGWRREEETPIPPRLSTLGQWLLDRSR